MSNIIEDLKQKSGKIEQLRRTKANQEGQKELLLKQLKDKIGVNSVEEAERKLEEFNKELEEDEEHLTKLDKELDEIILSATPGNSSRSTRE